MTAYCQTRWKLYDAYAKASAYHYRNPDPLNLAALDLARLELQEHHRTCDDCKRHAEFMKRLARDAWQPEYEEVE